MTNFEFSGLSEKETKLRIEKYGFNLLPEKPSPSIFTLFLKQIQSPLVYVLLIALFLTLVIGSFKDSLVIFIAVLINSILGLVQEKKANDALVSLKAYESKTSVVLRDGRRIEIDSSSIVPGDIVFLRQGDKVPADGILLEANRLFVDESVITGESTAVVKENKSEVFMGSSVISGIGYMRVFSTGKNTVMGKIALQVQEKKEETPLQVKLKFFSRQLVFVILILLFFVFLLGLIKGFRLVEIFTVSVALAVSSIPEGLLVALTVILSVGMQRILKMNGLVRSLVAAETLGSVSVVCIDKTGTITEGNMKVVEVVGDKEKIATQSLIANDLDDPLVVTVYNWAKDYLGDIDIGNYERVDSVPFSSSKRYFASLNRWKNNKKRLFVNGAPEILVSRCNLSEGEKRKISFLVDELASKGMRLIGFAFSDFGRNKRKILESDLESGLSWLGLIALYDPVRKGVSEIFQKAKIAGIRFIVITGDYPKTAEFVLKEIGVDLKDDEILTGKDVSLMSLKELSKAVAKVKLFARTTPEQKLKIVEALKKNGEVVAMMGDGVNDAPALHKADIGVAVSEATDVAKESSDLVLLDSNFATIVLAIEEGRVIFENIRKVIVYLLADSFAEIFVILTCVALGLPLALIPIHILWINLVSDGFPSLALTVDPKRKDIMNEPPRSLSEKIVTDWMIGIIGIISLSASFLAFIYFYFTYRITEDIILARSFAFLALGLNSLIYVFSVRGLLKPFWKVNFFENRWLLIAVFLGFILQFVPFSTQITRDLFGLARLNLFYWVLAFFGSIVMFFVMEGFKFLYSIYARKLPLNKIFSYQG